MYTEAQSEDLMTRRQLVAFEIDYYLCKGNAQNLYTFLHHYHPTPHAWGHNGPISTAFPGISRQLPAHVNYIQ